MYSISSDFYSTLIYLKTSYVYSYIVWDCVCSHFLVGGGEVISLSSLCTVSCVDSDVRLLPGVPSSEFYDRLRERGPAFPRNFFDEDRLRLGRVEVCQDGSYTAVCKDSQWDDRDASVVCSQLGFSPDGKYLTYNT